MLCIYYFHAVKNVTSQMANNVYLFKKTPR